MKPLEIAWISRGEAADAVRHHRRCDVAVVNLLAQHAMPSDEAHALADSHLVFVQQHAARGPYVQGGKRFVDAEDPAAYGLPRENDKELAANLGADAGLSALRHELVDKLRGCLVAGVYLDRRRDNKTRVQEHGDIGVELTSASLVPVQLVAPKIPADPCRPAAQRGSRELALRRARAAPPSGFGNNARSLLRGKLRELSHQALNVLHIVGHFRKIADARVARKQAREREEDPR